MIVFILVRVMFENFSSTWGGIIDIPGLNNVYEVGTVEKQVVL